jgi:hypothetical protein
MSLRINGAGKVAIDPGHWVTDAGVRWHGGVTQKGAHPFVPNTLETSTVSRGRPRLYIQVSPSR